MIPSCPQPSEVETEALQLAAITIPEFADLERRRIVHCCRLEVLKRSDDADLCREILDGG